MSAASAIRLQIESALAARIPSALTPVPRVVRPVTPSGIAQLDEVVRGGLPVGAVTELVGPECSGRTTVALKFVAGMTQAGRVCAWIERLERTRSGFGSSGQRGSDAVVMGAVRSGETLGNSPRTTAFLAARKVPDARACN